MGVIYFIEDLLPIIIWSPLFFYNCFVMIVHSSVTSNMQCWIIFKTTSLIDIHCLNYFSKRLLLKIMLAHQFLQYCYVAMRTSWSFIWNSMIASINEWIIYIYTVFTTNSVDLVLQIIMLAYLFIPGISKHDG